MIPIFYMTQAGIVTGGSPRNRQVRKALGDTIPPDYAIDLTLGIGEEREWMQFDRLEPMGGVVGMSADIANMSGQNMPKGEEMFWVGAALMADNMTPEFMTENIFNFTEFINKDPKRSREKIAQFTTRLIPLSALLRKARKEIDPQRRLSFGDPNSPFPMWESIKGAWANSLPGFSESLPPARNIFGKIIHYPPGVGPDIISPFHGLEESDPLSVELFRIGQAGPLVNADPLPGETHLALSLPPRTVTIKNVAGKSVTRDLSAEEYDKFTQLAAGKALKEDPDEDVVGFKTKRKTLEQTLRIGLLDKFKDRPDEFKRFWVKKVISAYRIAGKQQLLSEIGDVPQRLRQEAVDRGRAFQGPEEFNNGVTLDFGGE
jgi:hypothetical protein